MRKMLNLLRFVRAFTALVRDPNKTERVFALGERLTNGDLFEQMPWLRGRPEIEGLVHQPVEHLRVDRAALRALPPGTLGREYADFMIRENLDPRTLAHSTGTSTLEHFRIHLQSTHDLWHVVTGFDTDVAGELGLQAFYFAQIEAPLPLVLISAGLLNGVLFHRESNTRRFEQIVYGYRMGRRAKPLFGIDWPQHWDRPLDELRQQLGLQQGPSEATELAHVA